MLVQRIYWSLLAGAVLIPALVFSLAAWNDFQDAMERAEINAERVAITLEEHTAKVMESNELILNRVLERIEGLDWQAVRSRQNELHTFLRQIADESKQVSNILLIDPDGNPVVQALVYPAPKGVSVIDREYFIEHRAGDGYTFITGLMRGRSTGSLVFGVSRRWSDPEGRFNGVVLLGMRQSYFDSFWRELVSADDVVSLLRSDGAFIARAPALSEPVRLPSDSTLLQEVRAGTQGAVFGTSPVDEARRIVAYRRVNEYPIYAVVGLDYSALMAPWWRTVALYALAAIISSLALIIAVRYAMRRRAAEQAAVAQVEHEYLRRVQVEASLVQSQKIEALGIMAGEVVHDFNNLIQIARGTLAAMLGKLSDNRLEQRVELALSALDKGSALTRQLLSFARKQDQSPRVIRPNDVIQGMLPLLAQPLGKNIALETRFDADVSPIMIDVNQFELGLLNAVVNARDAMPNGGVLKIEARNCAPRERLPDGLAGNFVAITIIDNGVGMGPDVIERAFEPFYSTKDDGKGTGLGLSMLHGFTRQSGGGITLESEVGQGTTITLYFPAVAAINAVQVQGDDGPESGKIIPFKKPSQAPQG
jgi:two-component system, NtrC family, sensor kinase